jgi:hypothetical protein
VQSNTVPTSDEWFDPEDDLLDMTDLQSAARDEEVAGPGMVVHLYVYGTPTGFGEYELTHVLVGWMGTDDESPVLR